MLLMNAVSASMIEFPSTFALTEVSRKYVRKQQFESRIGHADLAEELSRMLHREIKASRAESKVRRGESAIIAHIRKKDFGKKEITFYRLDVQ